MRSNRITIVVLCAVVVATGCHKHARVVALPPPSVPVPAPAAAVSPLDQADRAFTSSNYEEAARAYENYIRTNPSGGQRDQALFYLGLTYGLRPAPAVDWQRAAAAFKQLIDEYPNSPFKAPTNLILSLHSDLDQLSADSKQRDQRIKQLTTELDRLKKIDADRRRRP